MSQSYVKECIFCKTKVRMSDQMGKWLPFNDDGSTHECRQRRTTYLLKSFEKTSKYWHFNRPTEIEERKVMTPKKRTHCESYGEWLEGFDTCSVCGRINK